MASTMPPYQHRELLRKTLSDLTTILINPNNPDAESDVQTVQQFVTDLCRNIKHVKLSAQKSAMSRTAANSQPRDSQLSSAPSEPPSQTRVQHATREEPDDSNPAFRRTLKRKHPDTTHRREGSTESDASSTSSAQTSSTSHSGTNNLTLKPVSTRLTSDRTIEDLNTAARSFAKSLEGRKFTERKNNNVVYTKLQPVEIRILVNFFFHDVFGEGLRDRLFRLVDEVAEGTSDDKGGDPASLAAGRADDTALLPEVRTFFRRYSTWYRKEVESTKVLPLIQQTINAYDLYLSWADLRERAASEEGGQLREFLSKEGFQQSRGVDIRTCILRYLCRELGTTSTQLNNSLQAQVGVYYMVRTFGPGILVFLPKGSAYRINRLGHQKMEGILEALVEALPEGLPLCQAAEVNILQPIRRGEPIPLLKAAQAALRPTLTMYDAVCPFASEELDHESVLSDPPSTVELEEPAGPLLQEPSQVGLLPTSPSSKNPVSPPVATVPATPQSASFLATASSSLPATAPSFIPATPPPALPPAKTPPATTSLSSDTVSYPTPHAAADAATPLSEHTSPSLAVDKPLPRARVTRQNKRKK